MARKPKSSLILIGERICNVDLIGSDDPISAAYQLFQLRSVVAALHKVVEELEAKL